MGSSHSHGAPRVPGVLLLGAGNRGRGYTDWILRNPGRLRVVGVAEPDPTRRDYIRTAHGLPAAACFSDWQDALANHLPVDAVIVATQDRMHTQPAIAALSKGYHVLLEKPMATTREEVLGIAAAAGVAPATANAQATANAKATAGQRLGSAVDGPTGSLTVCHVLRYSSFFSTVKRVISDGLLGNIQSILHAENVAYYHFAHSYVRGNWRNSDTSSPLILAKSCHDLDILCWLADAPPEWVASTAGRGFFTAANAPAGAPERCTDGCPVAATCIYNAESLYLQGTAMKTAVARGTGFLAGAAAFSLRHPAIAARLPGLSQYAVWKEWPTTTITTDLTRNGILEALRNGPYGRCVFRGDNNQPDHQDTIIRFANGITATFRLHGRSHEEGRTIRIDGDKGTLRGRFASGTTLEFSPHGSTKSIRIPVQGDRLGHGDADEGIMEAWSQMVAGGGDGGLTSARTALASHLLAFAADTAATTGETQGM